MLWARWLLLKMFERISTVCGCCARSTRCYRMTSRFRRLGESRQRSNRGVTPSGDHTRIGFAPVSGKTRWNVFGNSTFPNRSTLRLWLRREECLRVSTILRVSVVSGQGFPGPTAAAPAEERSGAFITAVYAKDRGRELPSRLSAMGSCRSRYGPWLEPYWKLDVDAAILPGSDNYWRNGIGERVPRLRRHMDWC